MLIRISSALDRLTVYADHDEHTSVLGFATQQPQPVEVVRFDKPVLLTDVAKISQLPENLRSAVFSLYQSYTRTVEYDNVSVSWSGADYPKVWCPSIDTIFLARTLKSYLGNITSALEIGCGSGFLAKYMLRHGPQLKKVTASDIDIDAIRCAHDALADEPERYKMSFVLLHPDAPTLGLNDTFDLIAANPPYIPRPKAAKDNPYEGLSLVHKLSQEAKRLLAPQGRIIINLSSVAGDMPLQWFRSNNCAVELLETMRVPLKVDNVTCGISNESKQWLKYLEKAGKLIINRDKNVGYPYWHDLRLYSITKAKSHRVHSS